MQRSRLFGDIDNFILPEQIPIALQEGALSGMDKVASSGNRNVGFACKGRSTQLELTNCQSTDDTPYSSTEGASLECKGCRPARRSDSGSGMKRLMAALLAQLTD